jgi:hypothetical protein
MADMADAGPANPTDVPPGVDPTRTSAARLCEYFGSRGVYCGVARRPGSYTAVR